jgi:hypothetical protein
MTPESTEAAAIIDEFPEQVRLWILETVEKVGTIYRDAGMATRRRPRQLPFWPRESDAKVIEVAAFQRKRRPPKRAPRVREGT